MSNQFQNSKDKKILTFSHLTLIWHLDFGIWILLILFFTTPAFAGSTGVSASRFIVRAEPGEVVSRDLVVSNLSLASQQYRLFLDGSGSERMASFIPSDFNLAPNQSQRVLLRFRQSGRSQQRRLAVLSYGGSQSGNLKIASGIKIPVYFIVPPAFAKASAGLWPAVSLSGRGDWRIYALYGIDFVLFSIVCLLYQRRFFWRRRRIRHKISFL